METRKNRTVTFDEMREIQKSMLNVVTSFCDENNIEYFLGFGTLLGAVRHRGFIPWDDDIDIVMTRSNYNKFFSLYPANGRFIPLTIHTNPDYYYLFGKITDTQTRLLENGLRKIDGYGVYIDVFPIDNLPDGTIARNLFKWKCWFYRRIMAYNASLRISEESFLRRVIKKALITIFNWRKMAKKGDAFIQKYSQKETIDADSIGGISRDTLKRVYPRALFSDKCKLEFENNFYYAPSDYDALLRIDYGEYMTLPPEDKRIAHNPIVYWVD